MQFHISDAEIEKLLQEHSFDPPPPERNYSHFALHETEHVKCTILRAEMTEEDGIGVSGLYKYFSFGTFRGVTAEELFVCGLDHDFRKEWDDTAAEVDLIDASECGRTHVISWLVKLPWPLSPRHYVYARRGYVSDDLIYTLVCRDIDHHLRPQDQSGRVRVKPFRNVTLLKEVEEKVCQFAITYFDNPGGNIPNWVINWAAKTAIPRLIDQQHEKCLEYPEHRYIGVKKLLKLERDQSDEKNKKKAAKKKKKNKT